MRAARWRPTLLCTDGVSNVLDAAALAERLKQRCPARALVAAARAQATPELHDDRSAIVLEIAETGRLRAETARPLALPETLRRDEVVDGFTLVRHFQQSDRVWLAAREGARYVLKFPRRRRKGTRRCSRPSSTKCGMPRGCARRGFPAPSCQRGDGPILRYGMHRGADAEGAAPLAPPRGGGGRLPGPFSSSGPRPICCGSIWCTAISSRQTFSC